MSGVAVIACGALAADVRRAARKHGWEVDVHPLPALLHNRPERIADAVRDELARLGPRYDRVVVAYADCGTYGALDGMRTCAATTATTCSTARGSPRRWRRSPGPTC